MLIFVCIVVGKGPLIFGYLFNFLSQIIHITSIRVFTIWVIFCVVGFKFLIVFFSIVISLTYLLWCLYYWFWCTNISNNIVWLTIRIYRYMVRWGFVHFNLVLVFILFCFWRLVAALVCLFVELVTWLILCDQVLLLGSWNIVIVWTIIFFGSITTIGLFDLMLSRFNSMRKWLH